MPNEMNEKRSEKSAKKSARFFWICSGLLATIMAAFSAMFRFEIFSASPHIIFAMFLGVVLTIGLAVGLMALAFHSDDSGIDDRL
jgi:hypothetical protein